MSSPESSPAKPFKAYEPGYVRIDVKCLPQMADEPSRGYVSVAVDRATCWVFIAIKRRKTAAAGCSFLKEVSKAAPFLIQTVLTDDAKEFTDRLFGSRVRISAHRDRRFRDRDRTFRPMMTAHFG